MYLAIFKTTSEGVEVTFPDAPAAITCGKDMPEAYEMAIDIISAILAMGKKSVDYFEPTTTFEEAKKLALKQGGDAVPINPDQKIIDSYTVKERVQVMLEKDLLSQIDQARANPKRDRSSWLAEAARLFLEQKSKA